MARIAAIEMIGIIMHPMTACGAGLLPGNPFEYIAYSVVNNYFTGGQFLLAPFRKPAG
jgi:hypothetical protein